MYHVDKFAAVHCLAKDVAKHHVADILAGSVVRAPLVSLVVRRHRVDIHADLLAQDLNVQAHARVHHVFDHVQLGASGIESVVVSRE